MILVFNTSLRGHYLEYFHHIYMGALQRPEKHFLFAYPEEDASQLKQMEWPSSPNVTLKPVKGLNVTGSIIKKARLYSKALGREVETVKADEVILTNIMQYLPFLPIYVHKTKVKGIIYTIYLYLWKTDGIKKRIFDIVKFLIFKRSKVVHKVYVLADNSAAVCLNKLYKTDKFDFICDPVVRVNKDNVRDLREELGVSQNKVFVLHAGDLSCRKGTIALLKGLVSCDNTVLDRYYFLFAGRISPSIKNEFDELYNQLQTKTKDVKLITGFIPFDFLGSMIFTSDLLMLNYLQTAQSSGFIGYAADFGKPVVVINNGLLKKNVRKFKLGYVIPDASPDTIRDFLDCYQKGCYEPSPCSSKYVETNSIENFSDTLIDG